MTANPSVTHIGKPVDFTPIISGNTTDMIYNWDFGDGNRSNTPGNTKHTYNTPGAHPVTLTITDPKTGDTAQTTIIIRVTDDRDDDNDGIPNSTDQCPQVK